MVKGMLMAMTAASGVALAGDVKTVDVTCARFEPGTAFAVRCWADEGAKSGEAAVYVFLEWNVESLTNVLGRLMAEGKIPSGLAVSLNAGRQPGAHPRNMRAEEFDQPGTEFPSALAEEIVPAAERALGLRASPSPDLHFIAGASSGGIAAWNACWFRNDWFRRSYCNSPTFSNIRGGSQLMPLVRKCETRPIRTYVTCGTDEPDYFFGDSYLVAEDAVSALRFAGYEMRFDRFEHGGHGSAWGNADQLGKVLTWLFEDWRTKPVAVVTNPIRVRDAIVAGTTWTACDFAMPAPCREARSSDLERCYGVSPDSRFVMSERVKPDGSRDRRVRLAPLELAWNATRVGGTALAVAADDRVWVATELGVQGVVSFGIADVVLPLPGDLPCDNVALVGTNLYASSGERVFCRPVRVGAADPAVRGKPSTPGYDDGFWYSRDHEPAGAVGELLGSYVAAGRIAGVVSVLSDADYNETYDCAGWSDYGGRAGGRMTPDSLFAIFSMTKTFTGAALMCAIDEGRLSLDDAVAKYLPEFADVKMKDGTRPRRALTIRDLTSHVTGFRGGYRTINRDIPLREAARRLAAQPLEHQPGETFSYGSVWFCAAAACLEVAVGEPFEKYLKRKVLDPLGMKDTTFTPDGEQLKRLVKAYSSNDAKIRPAADDCARQLKFPKDFTLYPAAGGGLFSTPRDMIRFSQMLAHHGTWKGKTIISRKTFDGIFAVKQTPPSIDAPYACGSWLYGDWFGHEGAMRTDQRANLKTGQSRVFFIQTENRAGSAFFQLKRDWHAACDRVQGTEPTKFGN